MRKGFFFTEKAARRLKFRFKCFAVFLLVGVLWLTHKSVFAGLYNFLALEIQAKPADVLVVEGWVFDSGKRLALDLYKQGFSKYIVTTGGPILRNAACFEYGTWAEVAKRYFVASGMAESRIISVATQIRGTRQQALALRPVLKKLDAGLGMAGRVGICQVCLTPKKFDETPASTTAGKLAPC